MQELRIHHEGLDGATEAICGPGSVPGACLAGIATLLLGAVCLADAFVAPGLFGPLAAAVIAAERLLCAVRSSSTRVAVAWTGIALCWFAVAACMVHTPLVSPRLLQWLLVSVIASSFPQPRARGSSGRPSQTERRAPSLRLPSDSYPDSVLRSTTGRFPGGKPYPANRPRG